MTTSTSPRELIATTVWPTVAAHPFGQLVGQLAGNKTGWGPITVGNLMALVTIPISLAIFGWQLMPYLCRRYTLTSRRLVIRKGLLPADDQSLDLDAFDAIDVQVLPGQEWFHAGDLVFRRDGAEVLRLPGVSRPDVFRQICLKARNAVVSIGGVLAAQATS